MKIDYSDMMMKYQKKESKGIYIFNLQLNICVQQKKKNTSHVLSTTFNICKHEHKMTNIFVVVVVIEMKKKNFRCR